MDIDFSKNFIKGKIAELIFEQMFREAGRFTVIPFGYESTLPEIAQYAHLAEYQPVIENIRTAPDFALVSHDKKEVFLVEVKYRKALNPQEIKSVSEKIRDRWKAVWVFVATPQGFFFNSCTDAIEGNGQMLSLGQQWISTDIQEKYLALVNEFVSGK
jgi:hypothetical protein